MSAGKVVRENPARSDEVVGSVAAADAGAVDATVRRAGLAQRSWARRSAEDRCAALAAAAEALDAERAELGRLLARESGKVLADAQGEVGFAATVLRWYAANAPALLRDREIDDASGRLLRRRVPYGVTAAITPWNAPVLLALTKIAPALAAGNAVVVKPSPLSPLAVDRAVGLLGEHIPEGLLGVVHGHAEPTLALAGHRDVRKVAFTGGEAAACAVAAASAGALSPTTLELGGNDPVLLLPDADLSDAAMDRLVMASFATSGQVCMAAKRVYAPRARLDEIRHAYQAAAARVLRIGDPLAPGVTLGPVVTAAARDRVDALVQDARTRGARVLELGSVSAETDLARGYFVRPTLLLDLDDDAPAVAEEQFGPTVPLLAYEDEDEAVARANASDLGLGASVWSADEDRAFAVAARLEAGFVFVNTHNRTGMSLRAPFGGVKRSGHGREYGDEGLAEYVQTCVVHAPAAFRPGGSGSPPTAYPA
ncbi:aldehyde dehydrogenase family protein [Yinghuangia soli]|uniref:Aldehyde dehydrogenase family protein n=1 Tax=Yinghuangia soli TaxID=2908204 RepID=A0AA41Q5A3_9ACTN|nr:aldehyde dehydrogenase family protein [Yinghuangia soli]MCF2531551.1 aldehyde dehydrogenase family protein [Yinghuangia soli]